MPQFHTVTCFPTVLPRMQLCVRFLQTIAPASALWFVSPITVRVVCRLCCRARRTHPPSCTVPRPNSLLQPLLPRQPSMAPSPVDPLPRIRPTRMEAPRRCSPPRSLLREPLCWDSTSESLICIPSRFECVVGSWAIKILHFLDTSSKYHTC